MGKKMDKLLCSKKKKKNVWLKLIQFPSGKIIWTSNFHPCGKWTGQEGIQHRLLVRAVLKRKKEFGVCFGVWVCVMETLLWKFSSKRNWMALQEARRKVGEFCLRMSSMTWTSIFLVFNYEKSPYESLSQGGCDIHYFKLLERRITLTELISLYI